MSVRVVYIILYMEKLYSTAATLVLRITRNLTFKHDEVETEKQIGDRDTRNSKRMEDPAQNF
jgi:hypothetical protein